MIDDQEWYPLCNLIVSGVIWHEAYLVGLGRTCVFQVQEAVRSRIQGKLSFWSILPSSPSMNTCPRCTALSRSTCWGSHVANSQLPDSALAIHPR